MIASILTNTGAMIALQSLRATNTKLADVQGQISTGKRVANAKDNAAVFAISKTMQSDVKGFQAITASLNLGASSIAVARTAAETVTDLLVDIKAKVVAAQEDNVDRTKIQADVVQLRDQINEVIGAAQFNGLNLVNNTSTVNILASLNRDSAGNVTSSDITLTGQDLSTTAGTPVAAVFDATTTEGVNAAGDFAAQSLDPAGGTDDVFRFDLDSAVAPAAGNVYSVTVAGQEFTYTAQAGDDNNVVAFALRDSINGAAVGVTVAVTAAVDPTAADVQIDVTNTGTAGIVVSATATSAATGGLANLGNFDVSTAGGSRRPPSPTVWKSIAGSWRLSQVRT